MIDLTNQQRRVLRCILAGFSIKQTAGKLRISMSTVESHLQAVREKMGANSNAQAVAWAILSDKNFIRR